MYCQFSRCSGLLCFFPMAPRQHSELEIQRLSDGSFTVVLEHSTSRGASFRVRYWRRGFKRKEKKFQLEYAAEEFFKSVWTNYQLGVLEQLPEKPPKTLNDAFSRFMERHDLRPKTKQSYSAVLRSFCRVVGGDRTHRNIYQSDIAGWLEVLKRTQSEASRASYLRTLKAFFSWSMKKGWIDENPTARFSISVPARKVRFLPRSDWEKFLSCCQPSHRIRAQFILGTGLRSGELLHARRHNIYRSSGGLVLKIESDPKSGWEPKRGSFREVPLSGIAIDALQEARRTWRRGDYLFSNALLTAWNGCRENKRACSKAGLEYINIHGLRASFATYLLQLGIDLLTISRLLGHTDHQVLAKHYAGVSTEVLSSAIRRVNEAETIALRE